MPGNVSGFIGVEGSIRCAGSANRSLSHLEPVSGTLKWKLENGEQCRQRGGVDAVCVTSALVQNQRTSSISICSAI
jgi:hypothetical protein